MSIKSVTYTNLLSNNFLNIGNNSKRTAYEKIIQNHYSILNQSLVRINIYDVLGRKINTLVNKILDVGAYEYTFDASDFVSGVYFYRLETKDYLASKKMILIK